MPFDGEEQMLSVNGPSRPSQNDGQPKHPRQGQARLFGMVNSAAGYERQFAVIDGAADLFYELWGPEFVRHARAGVGIAELARRPILEIMGEFEITAA